MGKTYRNIYIFFIVILILTPIGFKRYFNAILNAQGVANVLHFHTSIMLLWCGILIAQPILIKMRKTKAHKLIGKSSYIIFPIIVFSIIKVIVFSFDRMQNHLSIEENLAQIFLPISQLFLFALFFLLAIVYTHRPHIHMRYIIVSSISLFGPTIGRIDLGIENINTDLWFMNLCLLSFIIYDIKTKSKSSSPYYAGLAAYALIHVANLTFSKSDIWINMAKKLFV